MNNRNNSIDVELAELTAEVQAAETEQKIVACGITMCAVAIN